MIHLSRVRLFCAIILLMGAKAGGEPIAASPRLPATTPWDLKQLGEVPTFEWQVAEGPVRSLYYQGEPFNGKPTRVFAYYASPATLNPEATAPKRYPGVVLIHGGGGTAYREWVTLWAKRGYAAIAMDLAGRRPVEGKESDRPENRTPLLDGGPDQSDDYKFGQIDQPVGQQWPYHAVAAAVRAHSLLRSFPEVDAERTAVTGISWGGYLTCIVAGVDSRFKAAVPVYGCGFLHEESAWLDRLNRMESPQRERWIALWDPSRYLPAVSMPILFVNGTNDFAYPLSSYMRSYDAVTGKKQLCITINMPHGHSAGWAPQEIGLFVDSQLLSGKPLAVVGEPRVEGDRLVVECQSPLKLIKAELHVTVSTSEPINKRQWATIPAQLQSSSGENYTAKSYVLPAGVTSWFMTVTDERNAVTSSRVTLSKGE